MNSGRAIALPLITREGGASYPTHTDYFTTSHSRVDHSGTSPSGPYSSKSLCCDCILRGNTACPGY